MNLRLPRFGKQLADAVERFRIRGRIRPWGAPDGLLVDHLNTIDKCMAANIVVRADRTIAAASFEAVQSLVERLLYKRRLARARHTRHTHNAIERNLNIDVV